MEDGLVIDVLFPVNYEGFILHFDGDNFHLDLTEGGKEEFKLSFWGIGSSFTPDVFFAERNDFIDEKIAVKKTVGFFGMIFDELFL